MRIAPGEIVVHGRDVRVAFSDSSPRAPTWALQGMRHSTVHRGEVPPLSWTGWIVRHAASACLRSYSIGES